MVTSDGLKNRNIQSKTKMIVVQNPSSDYDESAAIDRDIFLIESEEEWKLIGELCDCIGLLNIEVICGHGNDSTHLEIDATNIYKQCQILDVNPSQDVIDFVKKASNRNFINRIYNYFDEDKERLCLILLDKFGDDFIDQDFHGKMDKAKLTSFFDYFNAYKLENEKNKNDLEWIKKRDEQEEKRIKEMEERTKYYVEDDSE